MAPTSSQRHHGEVPEGKRALSHYERELFLHARKRRIQVIGRELPFFRDTISSSLACVLSKAAQRHHHERFLHSPIFCHSDEMRYMRCFTPVGMTTGFSVTNETNVSRHFERSQKQYARIRSVAHCEEESRNLCAVCGGILEQYLPKAAQRHHHERFLHSSTFCRSDGMRYIRCLTPVGMTEKSSY